MKASFEKHTESKIYVVKHSLFLILYTCIFSVVLKKYPTKTVRYKILNVDSDYPKTSFTFFPISAGESTT
jgi:hypothetical protein